MKKILKATLKRTINKIKNKIDLPVIILIYHRITTLLSDPQLLAVTPENFKSQMKYLKDNFDILRIEDPWFDIKKPSVVVTFDDGYADNSLEALPILEELEVPATFFISTANIDTLDEFWWDELENLILLNNEGDYHNFPDIIDNKSFYEKMHPFIKSLNLEGRERYLAQLRGINESKKHPAINRKSHRSLSTLELKNLSKSEFATIGAHTHNHPCLSCLTREEQFYEIKRSKDILEKITEKNIQVFSYPFGGRGDYNNDSIEILRSLGFVKSASNFEGNWHKWTDDFQIPRNIVRNWDLQIFKSQIEKFWSN